MLDYHLTPDLEIDSRSAKSSFPHINRQHSKDAEVIDTLLCMAADNLNDTRAKLAACVVHKGRIVSFGLNRMKSHPFQLQYGKNRHSWFLHAEIDAIYRATKRLSTHELSKSTLYVARVKFENVLPRRMTPGLARPCVGCARCIVNFDLKRVVYTTDQGFSCEGDV